MIFSMYISRKSTFWHLTDVQRSKKLQIHFRKTGKAQPVICPYRFLKNCRFYNYTGFSFQIYNKFIEPSTSTQKISYTTTLRNTRYLIISLKYILLCHCQKYANKNIIFYWGFYKSTTFHFESCRFYKTKHFCNFLSNNSVSRKYLDKYRTSAMH